jgi:hypothetical protein
MRIGPGLRSGLPVIIAAKGRVRRANSRSVAAAHFRRFNKRVEPMEKLAPYVSYFRAAHLDSSLEEVGRRLPGRVEVPLPASGASNTARRILVLWIRRWTLPSTHLSLSLPSSGECSPPGVVGGFGGERRRGGARLFVHSRCSVRSPRRTRSASAAILVSARSSAKRL